MSQESADTEALSAEDIQVGIQKCLENADDLVRRCALALVSSDYPTATHLAITRFEEIAKAVMLADCAKGRIAGGSWKTFWQETRNHKKLWEQYGRRFFKRPEGGFTDAEWEALISNTRNEARFKNLTLYVQRWNGGWRGPPDLDLSGQAEHVIGLGSQLLAKLDLPRGT